MAVSTQTITSKATVLATFEAMKVWPYWHEIFLNCVKESPMSYAAFTQAVQEEDGSQEAFERAMAASRMTQEQFNRFLPEYQKFMALQKVYQDVGMLSDGVDQIWHAHMLVSSRYDDYCMEYLGFVLHHFPCSLYELYGVSILNAGDNCLAKCNPTTCGGTGGGGGCKRAPDKDEDPQAIQQSILNSARNFVTAYTEVFDEVPSPIIWNQLHSTKRFTTA